MTSYESVFVFFYPIGVTTTENLRISLKTTGFTVRLITTVLINKDKNYNSLSHDWISTHSSMK